MATFSAATSGNWHDGATWGNASPGVEGTDYPGTGDTATSLSNYTVTIAAGTANCRTVYMNGGKFAMTAGTTLNIDDSSGAVASSHFVITASANSGFNSNGTAASPCIIKSASSNPTFRIRAKIFDMDYPDARTMDFSFCYFQGAAVFLGNDTNAVWFNTGNVTDDGIIEDIPWLVREQKYNNHFIDGRDYGRISKLGGHAGSVSVNGWIPIASFDWQTINDMIDGDDAIAYQSAYTTVPRGRIESFRPGRIRGPYVGFGMTIVEDH